MDGDSEMGEAAIKEHGELARIIAESKKVLAQKQAVFLSQRAEMVKKLEGLKFVGDLSRLRCDDVGCSVGMMYVRTVVVGKCGSECQAQ